MSYELNVSLRDIESGNPDEFDFIEQFCQRALGDLEGKINVSVIQGIPFTVNLVVDKKKKTGGGNDVIRPPLPPEVKWFKDTHAAIKKIIRLLNEAQKYIPSLKKADKKELATQLQTIIDKANEVVGQL